MLEFRRVVEQIERRRERLLAEAEIRRVTPMKSVHQNVILACLALALGDWLIRLGKSIKAPYQPVQLPIQQSEAHQS